MNKYSGLLLALSVVGMAGCASIVGDKIQPITFNSTPSDATITVRDEKGASVFSGKTPTTVTLNKSDGSYFGGKSYNVTVEKDGFSPITVPIQSEVNAWYLAGNLVFGGLIGWLIVDPFTGAMYNLTPDKVEASLTSVRTSSNQHSLTVVLLEDVPLSLREHMVRIVQKN